MALRVLHRFEWLKAKRLKNCFDFLAVLPAIEVSVNSTLSKFHGWKMNEKHWSNFIDSPYTEQYAMGVLPLSRVIRHIFKQILKTF